MCPAVPCNFERPLQERHTRPISYQYRVPSLLPQSVCPRGAGHTISCLISLPNRLVRHSSNTLLEIMGGGFVLAVLRHFNALSKSMDAHRCNLAHVSNSKPKLPMLLNRGLYQPTRLARIPTKISYILHFSKLVSRSLYHASNLALQNQL